MQRTNVSTISHVTALALTAAFASGCTGTPDHTPIRTCVAANDIESDCRFTNAEDIVVSPGGRHLLIGEMGALDGSVAGSIVALDPESAEITVIYPHDRDAGEPKENWGDPGCRPIEAGPAVTPHGLDIETREDGRHQLFVVNHLERESIELFEVIDDGEVPKVEYRGCVLATGDMAFNDVIGHPDGSFWVSHTYPHDSNLTIGILRIMFTSYAPGRVYSWAKDRGFVVMPGTEAKYANGIEKSADGRVLFLNSYFGEEVIKVDAATGERLGSVSTHKPDNSAWTADGELLVAVHEAGFSELTTCLELTEGSCGVAFEIIAIDPDTMTSRTVVKNVGAPMGAATVARPHGDFIYLGTFAGDRIARVPIAKLNP